MCDVFQSAPHILFTRQNIMNRAVFCCGVCEIDSSYGVSAYLVKPRRSTAWWRPSLHATVTATLMSFSPLVSELIYIHFLSYGAPCECLTYSMYAQKNVYMTLLNIVCFLSFTLMSVCSFVLISDTCYILSFSIIMLNTSLHNPCVKEKTTLDRFISMNRGINNGENLPDDLLSVSISIYIYIDVILFYFFDQPKHRHFLLCVYYVSPPVNCSEILLRPTIFIPHTWIIHQNVGYMCWSHT